MIPRLVTIAAVYAACVLGIALVASVAATIVVAALDDLHAFSRARRWRKAKR